ncbi:MAG: PD-(D/E)XK nuclease family protein [Candidatus Cloacimonetes bacterium]|nr:PD-(D/E)XK nuclease family protein [Candidatus Cloacimonadota bacterium]MDY0173445.1 PD-(D/E)XK nuclease family protein [Candidatus Cloacimonadaceae bacterium]
MKTNLALQTIRQSLHLSSSQINQYLLCSKKYEYHYVKGIRPTHTSVNLIFGSAIHSALEQYYLHYQRHGKAMSADDLGDVLCEHIASSRAGSDTPIRFSKEMPDLDAVEAMGRKMLEVFSDQVNLEGFSIEAVELPLSAPLYDLEGFETGFDLVGVIDLLLRDQCTGEYVAVDHKTARNSYSHAMCEDSIQMSLYAWLLEYNGYLDGKSKHFMGKQVFRGRFDVLRKLKTPKFEQVELSRSTEDLQRFETLALDVLTAIDKQVFLSMHGWQCADCGYRKVCRG